MTHYVAPDMLVLDICLNKSLLTASGEDWGSHEDAPRFDESEIGFEEEGSILNVF